MTPSVHKFTGERVVPWNATMRERHLPWVMAHHVQRYAWALPQVAGKKVVDLGCGTGYGSFMLSWLAEWVTGLDVNGDAIVFAKENFGVRVRFGVCDLERDDLPDADVYVAFEALEHLKNPELLIEKVGDRMFLWSMPVNHSDRQFHWRPYSVEDVEKLLPGSGLWFQSGKDGRIVPIHLADFPPKHVVGKRYG